MEALFFYQFKEHFCAKFDFYAISRKSLPTAQNSHHFP